MRDLIRPILSAVGAWVGGSIIAALVLAVWATAAQLQSTTGKVLWVVIPQLLIGGLAAAAAAYAHRRPYRDDPRRHAIAALSGVGVLAVVQALINLLGSATLAATGMGFLAQIVGGALGWLLVSRVVRHDEHRETTASRFYY